MVTFVNGTAKIAPDHFAKVTQKEIGWGLWSETSVDVFEIPHTITPEDLLALDNFFRSLILNHESEIVGANASVTYFPPIDCNQVAGYVKAMWEGKLIF